MSSTKCHPEKIDLLFEHGGDLRRLSEYFGVPTDQSVDFSASINPLGFPPGLESFLTNRFSLIKNYPECGSQELTKELARYLKIPSECILIGNGSMESLDLVFRGIVPKTVGIVEPAFSEYRRLAVNYGVKIQDIESRPELLFVGNPGNPTGTLLTRLDFQKLQVAGNWLVIDEAFVEFAGEDFSFVSEVCQSERLIVIRSMTKFFSIPGLRLGYLVSNPENISRFRDLQLPWSVNALAQAAGVFVLSNQEFPEKSREFIREERRWLFERLNEFKWIEPFPSHANFILCKIRGKAEDTFELFDLLGKKGIFIRPCHNFIGLGPLFFRVAVRTRLENEKLIKTLSDLFQ